MSDEKQQAACTPAGGNDTPLVRVFIEKEIRAQGWTDLQWRDEIDDHGLPVGRLYGRRP